MELLTENDVVGQFSKNKNETMMTNAKNRD
jgi:hypothetical protein